MEAFSFFSFCEGACQYQSYQKTTHLDTNCLEGLCKYTNKGLQDQILL